MAYNCPKKTMSNLDFPLPPKYCILRILPNGYQSRSALILNSETNENLVCKSIAHSKFRSDEDRASFIKILGKLKSIVSPVLLPYSEIIDLDSVLLLIRPFLDYPSILSDPTTLVSDINQLISNWNLIASAVIDLHQRNICSLFLKPSNIFFTPGGVYVTDLCPIPIEIDKHHTPNPYDIGFLAPELFTHSEMASRKSDYWSLGILLIYFITRHLPWNSHNILSMIMDITNKNSLSACLSALPSNVKTLIEPLVSFNQNERHIHASVHSIKNETLKVNTDIPANSDDSQILAELQKWSSHNQINDPGIFSLPSDIISRRFPAIPKSVLCDARKRVTIVSNSSILKPGSMSFLKPSTFNSEKLAMSYRSYHQTGLEMCIIRNRSYVPSRNNTISVGKNSTLPHL